MPSSSIKAGGTYPDFIFPSKVAGNPEKEADFRQETVKTTTLATGIAFGGEIVFSLGGIPLGLNVEIGQGFGKKKTGSQSKGLAGVYAGGGVHAYF